MGCCCNKNGKYRRSAGGWRKLFMKPGRDSWRLLVRAWKVRQYYLRLKIRRSLLSSGRKLSKAVTQGHMENRKCAQWTDGSGRDFQAECIQCCQLFLLAVSHEVWMERDERKRNYCFQAITGGSVQGPGQFSSLQRVLKVRKGPQNKDEIQSGVRKMWSQGKNGTNV